ncbi:MAG: hypothetical protein HQ582_06210 [Planctomycetes bacterium]|nr:hypothetical protein [Planctomycetota bacterium]
MARETCENLLRDRREFLRTVSATAAASGLALSATARAAEESPAKEKPADDAAMPTIQLGEHRISRLVAGWNPIGGHSHTTWNMAQFMKNWFTVDRTVEFLQSCGREGVNAWQFDHSEKGVAAIQKAKEQGSEMKLICLHAARVLDAPIQKVIDDTAPIAMVHHGGVTDAKFRAGNSQEVHDFVKEVHDHGLLAGVSAHNPDNIKKIADEGWENDLFMTCFYFVTRPRDEQAEKLGKVTVGEPFFESDPADMTAVARQVDQPCLGFKILAAGRSCWHPKSVEKCFRFAFENLKPIDGVIVGMFPVHRDEVAEDAAFARKHATV